MSKTASVKLGRPGESGAFGRFRLEYERNRTLINGSISILLGLIAWEILNRLLGSCHNHDLLVTTEKDAVKLSAVNFPKPCYQVGVELVFDEIAPLDDLLDHIMEPGK